jgi:hypothetical protein
MMHLLLRFAAVVTGLKTIASRQADQAAGRLSGCVVTAPGWSTGWTSRSYNPESGLLNEEYREGWMLRLQAQGS